MHSILLALLLVVAFTASYAGNCLGQAPAEKERYREVALETVGDAGKGEQLFSQNEQLLCGDCHRLSGAEKAGPNLAGIADKYSREELIRHILEPAATIKPGYEQVAVVRHDGQVHSGRLVRSTKEMVRVMDAKGKSRDISRSAIEQIQAMQTSMMPDNLTASISPTQFADLIAYLESLHYQGGSGVVGPETSVEMPPLARSVQFTKLNPESPFANPVWAGHLPGRAGEIVVIEHQEAKIWRLRPIPTGLRRELFLDLSHEVKYGNNWGLMCVAFHPQFNQNRRYFLEHEVEDGSEVKTVVVERRATSDLTRDAGNDSVRLIEVVQPAFNHNGGCIAFGPEGMLYAAFGDGGPQRDPNGYCQDPRILHGSVIRIDVDRQENGRPYAIPADNPFLAAHRADATVRPETWAIGFREPWRFSFDPLSGELWLGDVGQEKYEEVCLVRAGENHGWNVLEAFEPFSDEFRRAGTTFTPPVFAYHHRVGVSITGGHVYRGTRSPSFAGVYIFGDYETRKVWGLRRSDDGIVVRELGECPEHLASFGIDEDGELLAVGYEGTIFQIDLSGARFP